MSSTKTPQALSLTKHSGNIFQAPNHTVLVHACNTQGSWGSGIALAFKKAYPNAFQAYHSHCLSKDNLIRTGTCLLIPPCESDSDSGPKHWIACLFTSAKYGRNKDSQNQILRNTRFAVGDLLEQVDRVDVDGDGGERIEALRMCKINSGKFGVEWGKTEMVLKEMKAKGRWKTIEVWDRDADFGENN